MEATPSSILIIGAGVFGLSAALALLKRPRYAKTKITIIDASPELPNPSGSSVDSSRIIRTDYSDPIYAKLAAEAQVLWRDQSDEGWGGQGRYFEPGFLLTVDEDDKIEYLKNCLQNVTRLAGDEASKKIEVLDGKEAIRKASGYKEASGQWGYVNRGSGWSDAAKVVEYMVGRVRDEGKGRVELRTGVEVEKLRIEKGEVVGVDVGGEEAIRSDLIILAAGAWSGSLIDLTGRALATGQALAYIDISEEEQKEMEERPTVMNMSRGMFIIPPRGRQLKVARHAYGYRNTIEIPTNRLLGHGGKENAVDVSVPLNGIEVPKEGQDACREALKELLPQMGDRPFIRTRVCWYCDTPSGDFIIDWLPAQPGLFVATGGSGHGFKFAPVIGERIVDGIEGRLDSELKTSWRWREEAVPDFYCCEDGSRAGRKNMILKDEMAKT